MTVRARLRRIPVLLWIAIPVALAALVAWPLGGWDTVTLVSRTLPEYASNQVLHTHRFDVRVDDAWLTMDHHPAGYGAPDTGIYLVVQAEFTNVTHDVAGSSDLGGYLIPEVDGFPIDQFTSNSTVLVTDRTSLPELNPGLPRDLYLVWTIPEGSVKPGDDLRIDMYDGVPSKSILFAGLRYDWVQAAYAVRNVDLR